MDIKFGQKYYTASGSDQYGSILVVTPTGYWEDNWAIVTIINEIIWTDSQSKIKVGNKLLKNESELVETFNRALMNFKKNMKLKENKDVVKSLFESN